MATRRHGAARGVVWRIAGRARPPSGSRSRRPLGGYGFVATFQPDPHFGRILAAYGGVFVAGSLGWGMLVDSFRPDRYDLVGAALCLLAGMAVIMYAPRAARTCPTRLELGGGRCWKPTRQSSGG